ncbi:MAG: hypothetical protein ACI8RZ_007928 [Myxococcota bacterium]|jgi:hypothetical protein
MRYTRRDVVGSMLAAGIVGCIGRGKGGGGGGEHAGAVGGWLAALTTESRQ